MASTSSISDSTLASSTASNGLSISCGPNSFSSPQHRTAQSVSSLQTAPAAMGRSFSFCSEVPDTIKISNVILKFEFFAGVKSFYSGEGLLFYVMKKWGINEESPWLTALELEENVRKHCMASDPSTPEVLSWKLTYRCYNEDGKSFIISSSTESKYFSVQTEKWKWRFSKAGATTRKMNDAALKALSPFFRFKENLLKRFDPDPESEQPQCTLDTLIEM